MKIFGKSLAKRLKMLYLCRQLNQHDMRITIINSERYEKVAHRVKTDNPICFAIMMLYDAFIKNDYLNYGSTYKTY